MAAQVRASIAAVVSDFKLNRQAAALSRANRGVSCYSLLSLQLLQASASAMEGLQYGRYSICFYSCMFRAIKSLANMLSKCRHMNVSGLASPALYQHGRTQTGGGGHREHVPPPNQWLQRWSDRVGFVGLAGYIPKCIKTCMKLRKIACVMIISGRGSAPDPTGGACTTLPSRLGRG